MAKERKSKRQKLLSDKRHSQKSPSQSSEQIYSLSDTRRLSTAKQTKKSVTTSISTSEYGYLTHDLRKFAIITGSILAVELGIYWTSVGF